MYILSGLGGTGKYAFPGQRAEVYPFQSIHPGKGGKFKPVYLYDDYFGCTILNCKIIRGIRKSFSKPSIIFFIAVRVAHPGLPCNGWDMTSPTCFDYQYRSTDTHANMTLGIIFGNPPDIYLPGPWTGSWVCYPLSFPGDCMVCSDSQFDDNPLDGLYPSITLYSYSYSYACERENIPDSEIVDGTTNFEYRQEVCGNAPKPDNTNIQIKGFEAESTDEIFFGCNIFANERYVGKMRNTLTTKTIPGKYLQNYLFL